MENTLLDIETLALFFFNYSQEDIENLKSDFEFRHFWENKRFSFSDDSNVQLWMGFTNYFNLPTKKLILDMARKRYLNEAQKRLKP